MYLAVDNTAAEREGADKPPGLEQLFNTSATAALLSDQPTTRAPTTRAETVPLLAGGTDERKRPQTT